VLAGAAIVGGVVAIVATTGNNGTTSPSR